MPVSLSYQLAHRFDGDQGLLHQFLLGIESVAL